MVYVVIKNAELQSEKRMIQNWIRTIITTTTV